MNRLDVWTAHKNAWSTALKSLDLLLPVCLLTGGLGLLVSFYLGGAVADSVLGSMQVATASRTQADMLVNALCQTAVAVVWAGPFGALGAGVAVYLWVMKERGQRPSFYDGLNYSLNRLGRVVGPHWRAFALIALGNIVVIGAVIWGLQFAFVDAIAVLDDREAHPLQRSRRLTQNRRRTLFLAFLPFLLWWLPFQLALTFWAGGEAWYVQLAAGTVDALILAVIDLIMVQFYLDLFKQRAAAAPAPAPAG